VVGIGPTTHHPPPTTFSLLTEEGLALRGNLDLPGTPDPPVVVCVHGFKGFKDWGFWPAVAARLGESGLAVLRFNFSHSGIGVDMENFTEGALFESGTYSREVEDLRAILSALEQGRVPGSDRVGTHRIGLLGHSRGSVAALAVAASWEFPIRAVALWNPVSSVMWWDDAGRARWRDSGYWEVVNSRTQQVFRMRTDLLDDAERNGARLDPVANAGRLESPLLVVVGAEDESVPPDAGRSLARSAPPPLGSLVEVPATGHTFGAAHPPGPASPALEQAITSTVRHFTRALQEP
jgi:pimeloyl-ACP methyl ester carboxylesterase